MGILESKDLCKTYGSGENEVRALDHVSLKIQHFAINAKTIHS